jgi:Transmembrane secretion effector
MDDSPGRPPPGQSPSARPAAGGRLRGLAARLRPDLTPLRHSAQFRRLYGGQWASFAGSMITYIALPYQIYRLTGSSLMVGLLSLAELAPLIAAGLLGGLLADSADRRRLILAAEAGGLGVAAGLAANAAFWHLTWPLFVLAVVGAACGGLQRPSIESLVPQFVSHADLPAASALTSLLANAAQVLGPALGGSLIAVAGLPAAYLIDAASCVAGLALFARLRSVPAAPEDASVSLRSVAEGLRYVRARPEILGTYVIDLVAMFFGAPFALFPAYAASVGGPAVLGLLYAAPGAGALLAGATSGWARHVRRHGRAIVVAVAGWGLGIAALGVAPGRWLALAGLALAGAADEISGIFRTTLWNQTIPARLRGRLAGLEMISYSAGTPLGGLESGVAASLAGSVRVAILSGGLFCVAGAAAVTAALPALWRYDAGDGAGGPDRPAPAAGGPDQLVAGPPAA